MKASQRKSHLISTLLLMACFMLTSLQSIAQQIKPAKSGYAPVNGIDVYYEIYGEGKPIVLLHGAFYTIDMNWAELIPELAKTRKVIALEMQGHGRSPFSKREMSVAAMASDVAGVMDYLKVDSADMAGYSMGGTIAYQFAVDYPNRLNRLVIISSTHKSSGWLSVADAAFDNFKPEFFDNTPLQTGYEAVAPDKTKWRSFVEHMITYIGKRFDIGDDRIARITSPVLLIVGDNDGVDKIELMKTYRLLGGDVMGDMSPMPKSQLAIVPGQTHVGVMMQTKTILGYMEGFLK